MKQGKKLDRKHKEFLQSHGFNPNEYLVERKDVKEDKIYFVHRDTKELLPPFALSEI